MQAIVPNRPTRMRPYAWDSMTVNPNPPRVGEATRISFPLTNPGPGEVVVERIHVGVALFGIGVPWEEIGTIGPIRLAPDPTHIEEASIDWTPTTGGHRCVRARIHVQDVALPLQLGCNLDVIEAGADEALWRLPFRLGNPDRVRQAIVLRMETAGEAEGLGALLLAAGRVVPAGQPIWLKPGEVVDAEVRFAAAPGPALDAVQRVEGWIGGRMIDGIQVTVHRPAITLAREPAWSEVEAPSAVLAAVG